MNRFFCVIVGLSFLVMGSGASCWAANARAVSSGFRQVILDYDYPIPMAVGKTYLRFSRPFVLSSEKTVEELVITRVLQNKKIEAQVVTRTLYRGLDADSSHPEKEFRVWRGDGLYSIDPRICVAREDDIVLCPGDVVSASGLTWGDVCTLVGLSLEPEGWVLNQYRYALLSCQNVGVTIRDLSSLNGRL